MRGTADIDTNREIESIHEIGTGRVIMTGIGIGGDTVEVLGRYCRFFVLLCVLYCVVRVFCVKRLWMEREG